MYFKSTKVAMQIMDYDYIFYINDFSSWQTYISKCL